MVGWPETELATEFKPYRSRWQELSILDGCTLWGSRVVVPPQGRTTVLEELHETHPGSSKMKALARSYVWWPKMDQEIEDLVKQCSVCRENRSSPPGICKRRKRKWKWKLEMEMEMEMEMGMGMEIGNGRQTGTWSSNNMPRTYVYTVVLSHTNYQVGAADSC